MIRRVRMDDFDPRIDLPTLKQVHSEFIKRGIPMTVAVNNVMNSRISFDDDVVDYVNLSDPATWDIQLHGWEHERYWTFELTDTVRDLYANKMMTKETFTFSNPTIFFPPWNESGEIMEKACKVLGLELKISRVSLREALWNGKENNEWFFWHWWDANDREILGEVLDKLQDLNKKDE